MKDIEIRSVKKKKTKYIKQEQIGKSSTKNEVKET